MTSAVLSAAELRALPQARRRSALERALGAAIAAALSEPDVVEALINADGALWIDRVGLGLVRTDTRISPADREAAIRLLAHEAGETVGADQPLLATILPITSDFGSAARVQAVLPPLVAAPVLSIRKRPSAIYTLDDYVEAKIATAAQIEMLRAAIVQRRNIVVAGGTGSGKTTLLNALLAEPAFHKARVVALEDTSELQLLGANVVQLLTKRTDPQVTMRDLVRTTLRLRPDRIVVGEVRDGAALDVLKAWNTGHPGGLLTLHANSAADALTRLEDLCLEAAPANTARLIRSAVDLVVFIARTERGRTIADILDLTTANGGAS
jgi:type IV secretion system protein VirB11